MELNERKIKILNAIIKDYLATGEPVGSRKISKIEGMNISSATIRNEMSDLEEMGYIVQPHTSAGRIPTDKGYRFYVDNMLLEKKSELAGKEKDLNDKEEKLFGRMDKLETILQNMAQVLAANTNYTSLVSSKPSGGSRIKFIQLSNIRNGQILCTVVSDKNRVVNKIVEFEEEISPDVLAELNVAMNTALDGLSIEEINLGVISGLTSQAGYMEDLVNKVLKVITEAITTAEQLKIYTSGATNIFKYPELSDKERATELLSTLERKTELSELMDEDDGETGIRVYIGDENSVQSMKDCSVVTATYELDDGFKGTIGVIGPKRMDYDKVVTTLRKVKEQLSDNLNKKGD